MSSDTRRFFFAYNILAVDGIGIDTCRRSRECENIIKSLFTLPLSAWLLCICVADILILFLVILTTFARRRFVTGSCLTHVLPNFLKFTRKFLSRFFDSSRVSTIFYLSHFSNFSFNSGFYVCRYFITRVFQCFFRRVDKLFRNILYLSDFLFL